MWFSQAPTTNPSATISPISSGITPAISNQNFCSNGLERCCPTNGYSCGISYPPVATARPPAQGQAVNIWKECWKFSEFFFQIQICFLSYIKVTLFGITRLSENIHGRLFFFQMAMLIKAQEFWSIIFMCWLQRTKCQPSCKKSLIIVTRFSWLLLC